MRCAEKITQVLWKMTKNVILTMTSVTNNINKNSVLPPFIMILNRTHIIQLSN
jgi:hypothetical protein